MTDVTAIIADLKEKSAERDVLIRTLEMWNQVEAQGIEPEDVAGFTFKEEWITTAQKRERLNVARYLYSDPFVDKNIPKIYNAVHMKDGTWRKLDPSIKAP